MAMCNACCSQGMLCCADMDTSKKRMGHPENEAERLVGCLDCRVPNSPTLYPWSAGFSTRFYRLSRPRSGPTPGTPNTNLSDGSYPSRQAYAA